ncbi:MAG TPA: alpha/beta hydrolase [Thermomicrobiaceae bacterium]|nr:alpha/beta hydrolase [Thermomicrobiaceae bacterium]
MRANVGEIELYYELTGNEAGPVIVLTHGIGGSAHDFAPIVPALAERFRVLTYDVRGHARSGRPASGYTITQLAQDLAGLLDALDIPQAIILGTSMGGTIAQRFILDFPEKTRAAIIMSTSSEVKPAAAERWQQMADEIERDGFAEYLRRTRPPMFTEEYLREHPEALESERRRLANNPDSHVYAQIARAVSSYNYTQELDSVRVPALLLVGADDPMTPPGGAVIISRHIPNAELHILPGYGHNLTHQAPDEVVRLINDFVDRVG